jgi:hypothetical protein
MTLQSYDPEKLDDLALRVLDISCIFRTMAAKARADQPPKLTLQDRKAHEWLTNLEQWARKAESELEMAIFKTRGTAKALEAPRRKGRGK